MWSASKLFVVAALTASAALSARLSKFEAVEPHMGTLVRITLYAPNAEAATHAFEAAFAKIHEIDVVLSDYLSDSEANRVCASAWRAPIAVSDHLFRVLDWSLRLSRETGGAFDVTLGPMIQVWREARKRGALPDSADIAQAGSRSGFADVTLDRRKRMVSLKRGMRFDFGGVGKGYAADAALDLLRQMQYPRALIAASGDLAIGDPPPGAKGWAVAIEGLPQSLLLKNSAVSTSGDSEQSVTIGGIRYSHIIDKSTGVGLTSHIRVSVIARRAIEADSYATAISALGPQVGFEFANRSKLAALVTVAGTAMRSLVFERKAHTAARP
ncbi:MAG: FAD:protein FMN transferase [Bryobacteraceae bacterium]